MLTFVGTAPSATSVSTTIFSDKVTISGIPDETGYWAIHASCSVSATSANRYSDVQLVVDGVVRTSSTTTHSLAGSPTTVSFVDVMNLERGVHTFQLQFRRSSSSSSATITCSNAVLVVYRLY